MIPYGRQSVSEEDVAEVVRVLRSDYLTQGPEVPAFERVVAQHCQARHAVAMNSATAVLHLACRALGVGPGDLVWTSPITFVASANCALYCGAGVDFVDIDPRTYSLSTEALAAKLAAAAKTGRLPKVVIPVHLCGQPCDMAGIRALADRYGFKIIEDASHAIGAQYRNQPVGNCAYSDITVFSFHPVKIITTGEGGVATTNDAALAKCMQLLRSHGITRDASEMSVANPGGWYYEQIDLGFNYRLTDLQAALGRSQFNRLAEFVLRRRQIADRYDARLAALPVETPVRMAEAQSAWHLYVVRVRDAGRHREVFTAMRTAGIGVNLHYIPVYWQPFYQGLGFRRGLCPQAEAYYAEAISLPMFPDLTAGQQDQVISALEAALA
jgi:UDP-4-amino-4,6-dideoxy-N-acetyl-beta-L-altrosamine transaminase